MLEWRPVIGYKGWYEVSFDGRVRRIKPVRGAIVGRILNGYPDKDGYLYLILSCSGNKKHKYIHQLVCEAFNGPKPTPKHEVNHWDGIVTNNLYSNLFWNTHSENNLHKCRVLKKMVGALHPNFGVRGEKSPYAKAFIFTNPLGLEISVLGIVEFCRIHNLQTANIYKVMAGKITNHKGWKCRPV